MLQVEAAGARQLTGTLMGSFVLNCFDHFEAASADVFVGEGVTDTLILGQKRTSEDYGTNTVVLPF